MKFLKVMGSSGELFRITEKENETEYLIVNEEWECMQKVDKETFIKTFISYKAIKESWNKKMVAEYKAIEEYLGIVA